MTGRTAPPPASRLPYLDGLRCLAVSMVLAYHGGLPGLSTAGFYGVDVFFVLSGYLITSLLLAEQATRGRIRWRAFWGRRARRLLPGLLLMLAAVDAYVAFVSPAGRYPGFRTDAFSVLLYASNWHFVAASSNYFATSAAPSLLTHTWSLAIEEQFYLAWPLALWAATRVGRRLRIGAPAAVLAVSAGGAVASSAWMGILYHQGASPSRLYYGTDTHASSILVGAALAALLTLRGRPGAAASGPCHLVATGGAALAAAGLGWAACTLGSFDPAAYQGGFLLVAVAAAVLLASLLLHPTGPAARLLAVRPVRYVGRISYGMYLWYFPLFAVLDRSSTGLTGLGLFAVRALADVAVAAASFHLLEARIVDRHRARPPVRWRPGTGIALAGAATAVAVLVAFDTPAGPGLPSPAGSGLLAAAAPPTPPAGGPGLRLLVTGDSTGMTLGLALATAPVERRYGLVVDDVALMGCGVAVSAEIDEHDTPRVPPAPCNRSTPTDRQWPALLQREIARFHPDVVLVVAGRWEVESRRPAAGAAWTDLGRAADRAYVRSELDRAASLARAGGARLALGTAPCFASGEQPDGSAWPEDSAGRRDAYNRLVRAAAGGAGPGSAVVDLDSMVCPGGRFRTAVGGVTVRAPDGVHYPFFSISDPGRPDPDTETQTEAFGMWIAPRVLAAIS